MLRAMDIDFDTLSAHQRYKLMASLIVPRPDRAGHHAVAHRRGQRRAVQHVQHDGRGPADRDAQREPPARRRA
jgi:hypothetical protein